MRLTAKVDFVLGTVADHLRTSWWFVPGLCLFSSIGLSVLVERVDASVAQDATAWYLFEGGPDAAREVLSTIASSMMTFTGVVFSVTVLVLQLASNQFSPRVLRTFLKDRLSQLALGIFVGTFVYALLGLRSIRGAGAVFERKVPSFMVWLSVILAIACVGAFVGFIHHVAQSIRAVVVIRRIGDDTRASLDRMYPEGIGDESDEPLPALAAPISLEVPNPRSAGVLAEVDADMLADAAGAGGVVVRVVPRLGQFVAHGGILLRVSGNAAALDLDLVVSAFQLRKESDVHHDVSFGLRELVDIAERALSPGVNDPSTAVQVLDELHDILRRLARRRLPAPVRNAPGGEPLLILPRMEFDDFVRLALDEIRQYGSSSVQVLRRIRELVLDVLSVAPAHRRGELVAQLELVEAAAQRSFPDAHDRPHTVMAEPAPRARTTMPPRRPARHRRSRPTR